MNRSGFVVPLIVIAVAALLMGSAYLAVKDRSRAPKAAPPSTIAPIPPPAISPAPPPAALPPPSTVKRAPPLLLPPPAATQPVPSPIPVPIAPAPPTVEFSFEADDYGFYPTATLSVSKGATVILHFLVRETSVYYGGLDFRSQKFKTPSVKPGGSTTVEFTAEDAFTIISYWPLSGARKAELKVAIQ